MLEEHYPIAVSMKGELVFGLEQYSTKGLDVYDYDATFECTFFAMALQHILFYIVLVFVGVVFFIFVFIFVYVFVFV